MTNKISKIQIVLDDNNYKRQINRGGSVRSAQGQGTVKKTVLGSKKVICELRPRRSEGVSHMGIWRKSIPGTERENSSPEVREN